MAFNVTGSCYFLEDGTEWDNTFNYNIGALVKSFPKISQRLIENDDRPSVYYWSNTKNTFIGNVAAGAYGLGFHLAQKVNPDGLTATTKLDTNGDLFKWVTWYPNRDNVAHSIARIERQASEPANQPWRYPSSGIGYYVGHGPNGAIGSDPPLWCVRWQDYNTNPNSRCEIENFTGYYNEYYGAWVENIRSTLGMVNSKFADNTVDYWNVIVAVHDNLFIDRTNNVGNPGKSGQGLVATKFANNTAKILALENAVGRSLPWRMQSENQGEGGDAPGIKSFNPGNPGGVVESAAMIPQYDGLFLRDNVFIGYSDDGVFDSGITRVPQQMLISNVAENTVINSEPYLPYPWPNSNTVPYRVVIKDLGG